jgi:cellobiose-specific phosphotransferase system component IIB
MGIIGGNRLVGVSRKGQAYVIAVMLVTIITVSLSVLLYAYMEGWLGEKAAASKGFSSSLSIEQVNALLDRSHGRLNITAIVRNGGSNDLRVTSVILVSPGGHVYKVDSNTSTTKLISPVIKADHTGEILVSISVDPDDASGVWMIKVLGEDGSASALNFEVT